jgi:hypothetical protein
MSKKAARRYLQAMKPGTTVKEFLNSIDMETWFDEIIGTELEFVFYALCPESSLQPEND